jgi:hypothetical protein
MSVVQRHTISLLCPTRGRPDYVVNHLKSILETAAARERLELMFYVDRDDPCLAEYEALFAERGMGAPPQTRFDIVGIVGDRVGTPKAINAMAGQSTGRTLMISNDDLLFTTPGWDDAIDRAAAQYPDGIFNIYFNDGYFGADLSCFPIVGRPWFEALGYYAPVLFDHCNVDLWVHRLGALLGRNIYLGEVEVEHRHFEEDEQGARFNWQTEGAARRRLARDNAIFKIFERYLMLDREVLQDVIEGRPTRLSSIKDLATEFSYNL